MDDSQLAKLTQEIKQATTRAQNNMMIPGDVKRLLLVASDLLVELTEREINRNAKGE